MPRYGFRTAAFSDLTAEGAARRLASLGFDCLELCLEPRDMRPERLDEDRCRGLRRVFDEIGIGLASVSYHGDHDPAEVRRANQERAVTIAHWMGADILVVNAERAVDKKHQWPEHVGHFRHLCRDAEPLGVTLAVEPEPGLVVGTSEEMARMMAEVGSPRLRVNLDVGHAEVTDDDPAETIRWMGDALVHLHLEDIADRVHRHLPFGYGDIDFVSIRQALEEIGYGGPYVADLFGQEAPPGEVAERALAAMRARFG
jgi:sugar phosphate isomerase/epimerase